MVNTEGYHVRWSCNVYIAYQRYAYNSINMLDLTVLVQCIVP